MAKSKRKVRVKSRSNNTLKDKMKKEPIMVVLVIFYVVSTVIAADLASLSFASILAGYESSYIGFQLYLTSIILSMLLVYGFWNSMRWAGYAAIGDSLLGILVNYSFLDRSLTAVFGVALSLIILITVILAWKSFKKG